MMCRIAKKRIPELANGEIPKGRQRDELETHVAACPACAREMAEFSAAAEWVEAARATVPAAQPPNWASVRARIEGRQAAVPRNQWMPRLALAVSAAAVFAAGIWVGSSLLQSTPTSDTYAQNPPPVIGLPDVTPDSHGTEIAGNPDPTPVPPPQPTHRATVPPKPKSKLVHAPAAQPAEEVLDEMARGAFQNYPVVPVTSDSLAVVLTPNILTGGVEAAVASSENSFLIDT